MSLLLCICVMTRVSMYFNSQNSLWYKFRSNDQITGEGFRAEWTTSKMFCSDSYTFCCCVSICICIMTIAQAVVKNL